jgi:hypothetical protein
MPAERMMLHCRSMSFSSRDGRPVAAVAAVDDVFRHICAAHGIELPEDAP